MTTLKARLSVLLPHDLLDEAALVAAAFSKRAGEGADWLEDVQDEFLRLCDVGKAHAAVALADAAMAFAKSAEERFDLLNLQGVGLCAMIAQGGSQLLFEARSLAFAEALQQLPESRDADFAIALCRVELGRALQAEGAIKRDDMPLRRALEQYSDLLPAFHNGRWGTPQHARAAEMAARIAQTIDSLAVLGVKVDAMPYWHQALRLTFASHFRAADRSGNWQPAKEVIEQWFEVLPGRANGLTACIEAREALIALKITSENPDHDWVEYYLGALAAAAKVDDAKRQQDVEEDLPEDLSGAVEAGRRELALIDPADTGQVEFVTFRLAYAIHALSEVLCDPDGLGEAIGLYEQLLKRDTDLQGREEEVKQAMLRANLAGAMALKGDLEDNIALARRAYGISTDARMALELFGTAQDQAAIDESTADIMAIIDAMTARQFS